MKQLALETLVPKTDFPILGEIINEQALVYLDNAATTQRPLAVLEKTRTYVLHQYSNAGRSGHVLAERAYEALENTREKVRDFIGAASKEQIIFTRSATESLNMIATGYTQIEEGDEIVVLISEHHANLLPWQRIAKLKKAHLKYMYLNDALKLTEEEIEKKITNKTKVVAVAHVSNVLGYKIPIEKVAKRAHEQGAILVVDATQSVPHCKVDVKELDADFMAFSAHKMLGPTGVGVLYGKLNHLEKLEPLLLGGGMVEYVEEQSVSFSDLPSRLEAGTINVEGIVGLGAAIDYLKDIGMDRIEAHEQAIAAYAIKRLQDLPYIQLLGDSLEDKVGVVAFNVEGIHAHDVGSILDAQGIAIRVGHHCAHPLMHYLHVPACCRASFYLYNSSSDVDRLIEGLKEVRRVMRLEP